MCLRMERRCLAHAAHIWRICGCFGPCGPKSEPFVNDASVNYVFSDLYIFVFSEFVKYLREFSRMREVNIAK